MMLWLTYALVGAGLGLFAVVAVIGMAPALVVSHPTRQMLVTGPLVGALVSLVIFVLTLKAGELKRSYNALCAEVVAESISAERRLDERCKYASD